jgi:leucyl/phenylalanyl-tRNA---protein transferase
MAGGPTRGRAVWGSTLVHVLKAQGFSLVDCQQETQHLSFMGARPIPRAQFLERLRQLVPQTGPNWSTLRVEINDLVLAA